VAEPYFHDVNKAWLNTLQAASRGRARIGDGDAFVRSVEVNFPVSPSGQILWAQLPSARHFVRSASHEDVGLEELKRFFTDCLHDAQAADSDLFVTTGDGNIDVFIASASAIREALSVLLLEPNDVIVASLDGSWVFVVDEYDEAHFAFKRSSS